MSPSRLSWVVAGLLSAVLGAHSVACSMSDASTSAETRGPGDGASSSGGAGGDAASPSAGSENKGDLAPTDNAVILVHAAGMPAFRLCFENEPDLRPQPDQETMPEANVVGVEVGSAVRLAPLRGKPGKIHVFNEALIRAYAGTGLKCSDLIDSPQGADAFEMPAIDTDYSKGVHLLVLTGCQGKTGITRTKEECGASYNPDLPGKGNLAFLDIELKGANRTSGALPTQVLHLSQSLESARNGGELAVTFGDVTTNNAFHASSAKNPSLFAKTPQDLVESPKYDSSNEAVYANVGFRVVLNGSTVLAQQSLADTQKLSAPRELPSTYYSAASNYVLLLLGSPAEAQGPDGGDPRKAVHLLAVPVVDPDTSDAGAGADGAAGDGGT